MAHWDEVQKKTKELMDEAVRLIKHGVDDASLIANRTAKAAGLHTTINRNRLEKHKAIYKIGTKVYEQVSKGTATATVSVDKTVKDLVARIKKLERESADAERDLEKFTVVKKTKPKSKPPSKSPSKRTGA